MLTWPWVGRPSWSALGPAQLCLPGNHGAAAAPPPSPSLPSVHFDLPAPVTAKHNTRPGKMCSEQSRAALLLREGGGVSGPTTRHPPPATRSQAGWEAARSALQGPASRAFLAVRLGRFAACLPCGDSFIEISFAYHVIHLLKRTSQCFLAYSRSWATSPQSSSRKDTQCPLKPLPVLPSSTPDNRQPTIRPYRSACLDTWHEWNRVLCGFFVTGFFL